MSWQKDRPIANTGKLPMSRRFEWGEMTFNLYYDALVEFKVITLKELRELDIDVDVYWEIEREWYRRAKKKAK